MLDLAFRKAFPKIQEAEEDERYCAAYGYCHEYQYYCRHYEDLVNAMKDLPTRMLTLPASARPPSTARPVQHA